MKEKEKKEEKGQKTPKTEESKRILTAEGWKRKKLREKKNALGQK
jgi:hypothetical protein